MSSESRRLDILSAREITDLYGLPSFTDEERRLYFDLGESERAAVDALLPATALHFVLHIGYFKAKRQFFVYDIETVRDDALHVLNRYFSNRSITSASPLSKTRRVDLQQSILTLFGYQRCDSSAKATLEHRARRTAKLSTQPIFILREVLQYLKISASSPRGTPICRIWSGRTVSGERQRIIRLLGQALTPAVEQQLEALLQADEGMYRISILKHEPKDFSYAVAPRGRAAQVFPAIV